MREIVANKIGAAEISRGGEGGGKMTTLKLIASAKIAENKVREEILRKHWGDQANHLQAADDLAFESAEIAKDLKRLEALELFRVAVMAALSGHAGTRIAEIEKALSQIEGGGR